MAYLNSRKIIVRFFTLIVLVNVDAVPLAAVVIPKMARDFYESSRAGGVMLAADGAGVIVGSLVFGVLGKRLSPYRSMMTALVLLVSSVLLLAGLFRGAGVGGGASADRDRVRHHGPEQPVDLPADHRCAISRPPAGSARCRCRIFRAADGCDCRRRP